MSDEYTYDYIIQSIENIRNDGVRNKWHPIITGLRCNNIECLRVGIEGAIIVEPFLYYPTPSWFYLTTVMNIENCDGGAVIVTTRNSIYTFVPNIEEGTDDLSG